MEVQLGYQAVYTWNTYHEILGGGAGGGGEAETNRRYHVSVYPVLLTRAKERTTCSYFVHVSKSVDLTPIPPYPL